MTTKTPAAVIATAILSLALPASAQSADPASSPSSRPADRINAKYPVPYATPTEASITATLAKVRDYLDRAMPAQIIDAQTRQPITDLSTPNPRAIMSRGDGNAFGEIDYTTGVTHAGMLLCADVTGDKKYSDFTEKHLKFIATAYPYFKSLPVDNARDRFGGVFRTHALDDCGAMLSALVKARRKNVGPDLSPIIDVWSKYIHGTSDNHQFRLPDGTLARHRPQPESVWADDCYMSIPALAQMGALTNDPKYHDDAAQQVLGFAKHLFNKDKGLFMHGRNMNNPDNPEYYWGRANGWAMMAIIECLETLPKDHPKRDEILTLFRRFAQAVAPLQSGSGLWHQMLDKPDTYLETSATAMFVYSYARAINRGYISPVAFGPVAQAGWNALTTKITPTGQVDGTCIATTFASDNVYYYNRPTSVYASHGYGPVLLAGAEMIALLRNPAHKIAPQSEAVHYVPTPK